MTAGAATALLTCLRAKRSQRGAGIVPKDALAQAPGRVAAPEPGQRTSGPREPTTNRSRRTC